MKFTSILMLLLTVLLSCSSQSQKEQSEVQTTETVSKNEPLKISWEFQTQEDEMSVPRTTVFAVIDGERYEVTASGTGEFQEIDKVDFQTFYVPEQTLAACQGFYAGLLQVIIVETANDSLFIKQGVEDRESEVIGIPEFETLKKFALKDISK